MFKIKKFKHAVCAIFICGAALSGCASGPDTLDAEASAAAQQALDNMQSGAPLTGAVKSSKNEPAWVSSPYSVYDKNLYVAAVGSGDNRASAERAAFAALTSVFGQSIEAEFSNLTNYSEAVQNGSIVVSENNAVREAVKTSSMMDSLVGAEIAGVWQDGGDRLWYAAAVLDKKKAAGLYAGLISGNLRIIDDITNIPEAEANTIEAFSRYQLAAAVADANELYGNLLSVLGGSASAGFDAGK
ncbi:MAG: LPP20 family lipoprotein, partial [Spirochaetaceae bacterium]|nr:LPP20 family lipoprotein [Spirochaetaceae bacterium]